MRYIVTFEDYDEYESITVDEAYYMGHVVELAKEKTSKNYDDFNIVSIVRV
jgi:hypothetical protein